MAKILIVDDEPSILETTKMLLEMNGHNVATALNGAKCFEEIAKDRPDLILLDVMIPDENGWETCRKIKNDDSTKDIPVVMFSVRTSDEDIKNSLEYAHADAHLNKPFKIKKLLKLLNKILEK